MSEEPTLPRLTWRPNRPARSASPRKRVRLSSPIVSSDPVFSSEDDPSVDNYSQERRKRKYRGPWYRPQVTSDPPDQEFDQDHPIAEKKGKRTLERQFDSGVWLGSDLTDNEEAVDGLGPVTGFLNSRFHTGNVGHPRVSRHQSPTPEEAAQKQIESCLETGTETIDLSSLSLTTISNTTIRPLASFACIPRVSSINEGVFSPLVPHLKIFLSSNFLTSLPGELFSLDRLSVLSLRGNQLHELPPAIGNLRNLTELNISQNSLRHLPYEILGLFAEKSQLRSFQIHPNPFIAPEASHAENSNHDEDVQTVGRHLPGIRGLGPWHPQWHLEFKGRSETRYLSIEGDLCKGPVFPHDELESGYAELSSTNLANPISQNTMDSVPFVSNLDLPPSQDNYLSRAPSLLEASLIACAKSQQLPYLPNLLPDESPEKLRSLLLRASLLKSSGGSKCTICGRNFIIPRTEWIEWWGITRLAADSKPATALRQIENTRDAIESTVPLIRRGCSWLCGPEDLVAYGKK
ncbi:hypothetical protein F5884DRAFT_483149 [Xylogone sp. PMI_703]|nr:hypothetical protein F5884DRAFT_483149 [Xylogone sp. PMI_703]